MEASISQCTMHSLFSNRTRFDHEIFWLVNVKLCYLIWLGEGDQSDSIDFNAKYGKAPVIAYIVLKRYQSMFWWINTNSYFHRYFYRFSSLYTTTAESYADYSVYNIRMLNHCQFVFWSPRNNKAHSTHTQPCMSVRFLLFIYIGMMDTVTLTSTSSFATSSRNTHTADLIAPVQYDYCILSYFPSNGH